MKKDHEYTGMTHDGKQIKYTARHRIGGVTREPPYQDAADEETESAEAVNPSLSFKAEAIVTAKGSIVVRHVTYHSVDDKSIVYFVYPGIPEAIEGMKNPNMLECGADLIPVLEAYVLPVVAEEV